MTTIDPKSKGALDSATPDPTEETGGAGAHRHSRRAFLQGAGAAAAGAALLTPNPLLGSTVSAARAADSAIQESDSAHFGRIFGNLRHLTWSLPSGQAIAQAMGVPALSPSDLRELSPYGIGLEKSTPLWYYILKEAEVMAQGETLGPVGGRIVAEVFIGLLQLDPNSYIQAPWSPTLPQINGQVTGNFRMIDFLTFAGVGMQR